MFVSRPDLDSTFSECSDHCLQELAAPRRSSDTRSQWASHTTNASHSDVASLHANSIEGPMQDCKSTLQSSMHVGHTYYEDSELTKPNVARTDYIVSQAAKRADGERSERARNAAIQRHAKKKIRNGNQKPNPADSYAQEVEINDKHEKYLRRNRLAAAKCRAKKKVNVGEIDRAHRKLSVINSSLKKQMQHLRGELTSLRTYALNHQDCRCPVACYNNEQARQLALASELPLPEPFLFADDIREPSFPPTFQSPSDLEGMLAWPGIPVSPSNCVYAPVTTPEDLGALQSREDSTLFGDRASHCGYGV